jgi:hypothetical protein
VERRLSDVRLARLADRQHPPELKLMASSPAGWSNTVNLGISYSTPGGASPDYTPPGYPAANPNAPGFGAIPIMLAQGNNDGIPVPPGAIGVLLCPPATSTNNKVVCNNSGASFAGVVFTNQPVHMPIPSTMTHGTPGLYIYADAAEEILVHWL